METIARKKVEQLLNEKVYDSGLIINREFVFLAASPGSTIFSNITFPYKILLYR